MKSETPREIAERMAIEHIGTATYYDPQRTLLADAIEELINNRDERAAKICEDLVTFTEDHGNDEPCKWCEALETAAETIRGKD